MREFGQEVINGFEKVDFPVRVRLHLIIGIVAGILFGSLEYFFEKKFLKKMPLGKLVFIGSLMYLLTVMVIMLVGVSLFTAVNNLELSWDIYQEFVFSRQGALFIFYCFLIGFLIDFIKEVDKKFGPGNLVRMLKGEFYNLPQKKSWTNFS